MCLSKGSSVFSAIAESVNADLLLERLSLYLSPRRLKIALGEYSCKSMEEKYVLVVQLNSGRK
jgi:hypothetical protein